MVAPLIGITIHPKTDPDRHNLDLLVEAIVQRVEEAGGLPLLIPLSLNDTTLHQLYQRLDGVLLSGGGDVDPSQYEGKTHAMIEGVSVERDRTELTLARWLAADSKPLFGICRGAQVLNVAMGGTLYADVKDEYAGALEHSYSHLPYDSRPHEVRIEEDTALAKVIGQPILAVNSLHHQALKTIAPGLRASAYAPDGVVEAIEIPDRPFALAVQWHPECLPSVPEMRRLFEAFVESARAGESRSARK
jgi:putative glutamine amidotransferase